MDDQVFSLIMARFDTIEEQNAAQLVLLRKHITDDEKIHAIVERHSAYFGLVSAGVPTLLGWIGYKLGLPK